MAFIAAAIIGGVGAIGGGLIAASGAKSAANTQAQAATDAAQLNYLGQQNALDFQKQQYANSQYQAAPWLNAGAGGVMTLQRLLGVNQPSDATGVQPQQVLTEAPQSPSFTWGPGLQDGQQTSPLYQSWNRGPGMASALSPQTTTQAADPNNPANLAISGASPDTSLPAGYLSTPPTFTAPTNVTEQNDPGYQFRLSQGQKLLENSAAARGGLLSGGTGKALQQFGQDYASNEYGNVYNRALNQYNIARQNQGDIFNRYAALSGIGQTAQQNLGMLGNNAASNIGNTYMMGANAIGNQLNNAAAARASGYVGSANALGGALGGLGNSISTMLLLKNLYGAGGGGYAGAYGTAPYDFGSSNIYGDVTYT